MMDTDDNIHYAFADHDRTLIQHLGWAVNTKKGKDNGSIYMNSTGE